MAGLLVDPPPRPLQALQCLGYIQYSILLQYCLLRVIFHCHSYIKLAKLSIRFQYLSPTKTILFSSLVHFLHTSSSLRWTLPKRKGWVYLVLILYLASNDSLTSSKLISSLLHWKARFYWACLLFGVFHCCYRTGPPAMMIWECVVPTFLAQRMDATAGREAGFCYCASLVALSSGWLAFPKQNCLDWI